MHIKAVRTYPLVAPKDSLYEAIKKSSLSLREGDIVAISSKVVSIDEGRTLPIGSIEKEELIRREADWYRKAPRTSRWKSRFTITQGGMASGAGIDESNGNGYYILYPKNSFKSARRLRAWLKKQYGIRELAVIITDSTSVPLRRGALGFALSWDGIDPLRDYRGTTDLFGRTIRVEMANLIDALAASAVLEMGEGDECTPLAVLRGAKNISLKNRPSKGDQLIVEPENDAFAPLFFDKKWKRGPGEPKRART